MTNEMKDYLNRLLNEARKHGLCHTQGEFAALLEINPSTLSKALQGDERYLTPSLIKKVRRWAEQNDLEKEETPVRKEPDISIPAATAKMYENLTESIKVQNETIRQQNETIRLQAEMLSRMQTGTFVPGTSPKNSRIEND